MNNIGAESKKVNSDIDAQSEFLGEQIEFHKSRAEQYKGNSNPYRSIKHAEVAADFRGIKSALMALHQHIDDKNDTKKSSSRPFLSLTQEDLTDLPDEQMKELSISSADKAEFSIILMLEKSLEKSGGIMSLDQIIVALYLESKEVQKRATVTARLYRMAQKEMIYTVPLKKGVYSLNEISAEEAEKLFKAGG